MTALTLTNDIARKARLAGLLYLVIIVTGLGAELGFRGPLIDFGDADATATAILAAPGQFRLAIAADLVMALSDAGLAILLYLIFRTMAPGLALSAMVFRLIQTVLIAASVMALLTAWLVLSRADTSDRRPDACAGLPRPARARLRPRARVFRREQLDHGPARLALGPFCEGVRGRACDRWAGLSRLAAACASSPPICRRCSCRPTD